MTIYTVGVLAYESDRILLVRHTPESLHMTGEYGIPSGRLQGGETEEKACVRKLCGETGLKTQESDLIRLPMLYFADIARKNGTERFSLRPYLCTSWDGNMATNEPEVVPEWVSLKDMRIYPLLTNVRAIIIDGLEFKR